MDLSCLYKFGFCIRIGSQISCRYQTIPSKEPNIFLEKELIIFETCEPKSPTPELKIVIKIRAEISKTTPTIKTLKGRVSPESDFLI